MNHLKHEMLPDAESPYEEVVLLDVTGNGSEQVWRHGYSVGVDAAGNDLKSCQRDSFSIIPKCVNLAFRL